MLTTAAPFGTAGTPAAITDGGGGAAMRRASNRRSVATSGSPDVVIRCGLLSRPALDRHFGDTTNSDVTVLYSGTSVTVLKAR
jgi:hypothetical protein